MEVLPGLWIAGEELMELIISEKIIATVDRLISNSHSRHVTNRRAAIPDESIRSINEIRVEPLLVLNFRQRIGGWVVIEDFLGTRLSCTSTTKSSSTNLLVLGLRSLMLASSWPPYPTGQQGSHSTPTGTNATITARIRRAREATRASCQVLLCEKTARWDCAGRCGTASVAGRLETSPVGGASIG